MKAARKTKNKKAVENSTTLVKTAAANATDAKTASQKASKGDVKSEASAKKNSLAVTPKRRVTSSHKRARAANKNPRWHDYALGIPCALAILLVAFFIVFLVAAMWPHGDNPEQIEQHRNIMGYLTVPLFEPDVIGFLTPDELMHMQDVKTVFNWAFICMLLFVGFSMIFPSMIAKRTSAGIIGGFAFITLLCALINARTLWTFFHQIFFPQGGWMFSPDSMLITLYPGTYFASFAVAVFIVAFIIVGLLNWHHRTE